MDDGRAPWLFAPKKKRVRSYIICIQPIESWPERRRKVGKIPEGSSRFWISEIVEVGVLLSYTSCSACSRTQGIDGHNKKELMIMYTIIILSFERFLAFQTRLVSQHTSSAYQLYEPSVYNILATSRVHNNTLAL